MHFCIVVILFQPSTCVSAISSLKFYNEDVPHQLANQLSKYVSILQKPKKEINYRFVVDFETSNYVLSIGTFTEVSDCNVPSL